MKALIIDDEFYCANTLEIMLRAHCQQINEIRVFTDPLEGLGYLQLNTPDILFLDVEMPHMTGFELLEKAKNFNGSVIFTTAFDTYAFQAFKVDAISYLLKPIDKGELIKAVEKASRNTGKSKHQDLMEIIQQTLGTQQRTIQKIPIPTSDGIHLLSTDEIIHCDADGSYSRIYCQNQKTLMVSKNLKELEELFNSSRFFRIHKSHLINLDHIKFVSKQDGGDVLMSNNNLIPVSRHTRQDFFNLLKGN